jgi:hypothetical protein
MITNLDIKAFILLVARFAELKPEVLDFIKECDVKELIKKEMKK